MFTQDYTDVEESGNFEPMPAGLYSLRITETEEGKSKNGHNLVKVGLVVNEGEHEGKKITHYITFLPPDNAGAGISKHWLHCIGEKYDGEVDVTPENWKGTIVNCYVKIEEYKGKEGDIRKSNKIASVYMADMKTGIINKRDKDSEKIEDVPF